MRFIDRWANSEEVKIHYLESADYNTSVTPTWLQFEQYNLDKTDEMQMPDAYSQCGS